MSAIKIAVIVNNYISIHDRLLNVRGKLGPVALKKMEIELKVTKSTDAICMVCGDLVAVGQPTVSCRLCDTPHHADCWSYVGKCSTYGCHSRHTT